MKTLNQIISKLKQKANDNIYYSLPHQTNPDVEKFFKETLGCKFIPKQILDFYKNYDGARIDILDIYSISEGKESLQNPSRLSDWKPKEINLDEVIEFATNGCGDSLYFLKNKKDENIYLWTSEDEQLCCSYDSFNQWLDEQLENIYEDEFDEE